MILFTLIAHGQLTTMWDTRQKFVSGRAYRVVADAMKSELRMSKMFRIQVRAHVTAVRKGSSYE